MFQSKKIDSSDTSFSESPSSKKIHLTPSPHKELKTTT